MYVVLLFLPRGLLLLLSPFGDVLEAVGVGIERGREVLLLLLLS